MFLRMIDMISVSMTGVFMNTYHRLPVTFARGEGVWLYDTEGKKYLDFSSGIAVNCLGHKYPPLVKAVSDQAAKLIHVCNYYQSDVSVVFAEKLIRACAGAGMRKVFFGNSGAEANEGAIKIARKYSFEKYGPGRHTIVSLRDSFHGRTITALSVTGQEKFHRDFGPFTPGFTFVPRGDPGALDKALDQKTTAGFLVEAVQGESGIFFQDPQYIRTAAKLCADRDILLMFDEIQCGLGRTGTFLAMESCGVRADVVTLAKGLAGGIPVGAVLAGEKAAEVLQTGDHGSTFGGNSLAAAAGIVVLDTVTDPAFLREIVRKGGRLMDTIRSWNHPRVQEIRGRGLMAGIDIDGESWPMLESCLAGPRTSGGAGPGLLILSAGSKTLRILPPYIIRDEELDQGLDLLRAALDPP
jgi:acetylornithine/N-succinyldiaminopimelate aminotransferase